MRIKHFILLLIIPLSEIKAIFYHSDKRVSWYLFSDETRYLCNVLEDYSNTINWGVPLFILAFLNTDIISRQICMFLFVLNCLDLIHLALNNKQGFIMLKILLAWGIYYRLWQKLKRSY